MNGVTKPKPWTEERFGRTELNTGGNDVTVCCGANENIEIVKLYGPLSADDIRVRLDFHGTIADWVVERKEYDDDDDDVAPAWVEMARFPCEKEEDK